MRHSINISRIKPPQLPRIALRSRLYERLKAHSDKRVIFITGQAAQGKSTLAAAHVQSSGELTAWITLTPGDSDALNLFLVWIQSLQQALPGQDLSDLLAYPAAMRPRADIPLYTDWIQAALRLIEPPPRLCVVLDGLDRLAPDASALRFLQVLVQEAPPWMRLFILSRELPAFSVEQMQISREALVLYNDDLAFTPDEVQRYFNDLHGIALTEPQAVRIHQLTEGWVGGLIILSETLGRLSEASREKFLRDPEVPQFKSDVFRYLDQEILGRQPEEVRSFLLATSILDDFTPALADDLTGAGGAADILHGLTRRNLFVQAVYDPAKGWRFRYHQLFKDFLRTRFDAEMNEEQRTKWYRRAGEAAKRNGEKEAAVTGFLTAGACEEAAPLIGEIGHDLLKTGRTKDLAGWLGALPSEIVRSNPWLLFFFAMTQRFTSARENAASLPTALALFEKCGDTQGRLLSMAYLIEAMVFAGHFADDITPLLQRAEALLATPDADHYPLESATLWSQVALGYRRAATQFHKGYWASRNAHLIAGSIEDTVIQFSALTNALQDLALLGEFALGEEVFHTLEELAGQLNHPELAAIRLMHSGAFLTFRGELQRAGEFIQKAHMEIDRHGLMYLYPLLLLHKIFLAVYLPGNALEVQQLGDHLLHLVGRLNNKMLEGITCMVLGESGYRCGDLESAGQWIERACTVLESPEGRSDFHLQAAKVVRSMIGFHARPDDDQNPEALDDVFRFCDAVPCHQLKTDAHFAAGLLCHRRGQSMECRTHLGSALRIAAEKGYSHFIILSPQDVARCCALTLQLDIPQAKDYARHLLATHFGSFVPPELHRLAKHHEPQVRCDAREIVQTVCRSGKPPLHIQVLGGFRVLRNGIPIPEDSWSGNQPRRLLKALVTRGGRGVPAEVLIEDLWPNGPAGKGPKNFKVNLHRLRKALEPDMGRSSGSSYIHLKGNLVSLDPSLCVTDLEEFLAHTRRAGQLEREGDVKASLAGYQQALDGYKGDLLPEELYSGWANAKREELRKEYIRVLGRVASTHEKRGATRKAMKAYERMIQADPLLEESYLKLMRLQIDSGIHSAAAKTYEECRRIIWAELGTEPSSTMTALLKRIQGSFS